jgi:protein-S-isoprenylcysteine O-methyltransferase Ste14
MFLRALLAFLALPGIVAIALPATFAAAELRAGGHFFVVGLVPLTAPWSPPKHLVTVGLYRYSRNPMYIAVTLMLAGWALCFSSRTLAIYTGSVMLGFHLRVLFGEEPWLARTHGAAWEEYKSRVPRWLL